jgi:hypothetical protein
MVELVVVLQVEAVEAAVEVPKNLKKSLKLVVRKSLNVIKILMHLELLIKVVVRICLRKQISFMGKQELLIFKKKINYLKKD